jgi:hypothetical protein
MDSLQASKLLGWLAFPNGWKFIEIKRNGVLSGFVMLQGNEIHAHRLPEFIGQWGYIGDIKKVVDPLIKQYGYVRTKVVLSNTTGQRFVQRLGFKETHRDAEVVHYKLERLRYAKHD